MRSSFEWDRFIRFMDRWALLSWTGGWWRAPTACCWPSGQLGPLAGATDGCAITAKGLCHRALSTARPFHTHTHTLRYSEAQGLGFEKN
jgi:hypothetical protein